MENTSRGAIIDQLIRHGALSRSEIARRTGLSRSVITLSTLELLRQGVIQKTGTGASTGGRRPTTFRLGGGNHLVVGVSFEDEHLHTMLYTLDGHKIDGTTISAAMRQPAETTINQVATQIGILRQQHPGTPFLGCGMAMASIVDAETDRVTSATHGWPPTPARQMLETATGLPCNFLDNAHAAALGELWSGGREVRENLVYLYIGRGIGGAIILDRQLYLGRNHAAGEFGPWMIGGETEDGPFMGRFEHLALPEHLIPWMHSVRNRYPPSILSPETAPDHFLPELASAITRGDPLARAVRRRLEMLTATVCANIVNSLNPDEIIIGGQITVMGPDFAEAVHARMSEWSLPLPMGSVRVHLANSRQETIPLGAAATIIQRTAELLTTSLAPE